MNSTNPSTETDNSSADPLETDVHADALEAIADEQVAKTSDFGGQPENSTAELRRRLDEAEREVLRSRAELENARKRLQRDAEQQVRYANLPLVRDLLDVIDNLNRAVDAAASESGTSQVLSDGVKLVARQFTDVLAKYACKPIESVGKTFDPNIHEAIAQMPSPSIPTGCVAQEVAIGYTLHERVIRPSQVIVSSGPA